MSPKNAQLSCWKQLKSWKSLVDLLLNNCNTLILRLKLRNNFFKNIAFTFASDAAMLIGWKHLAMLDVITQYTLPAMFLQNHCRLRQAKHADALHSPLSVRPDSEGTCNKLTTPVWSFKKSRIHGGGFEQSQPLDWLTNSSQLKKRRGRPSLLSALGSNGWHSR